MLRVRGAAQKEALGHGVGFPRRELWESGPFFSHGRHGLSGFALPCALAVMDFLGPGLKPHPVASWDLQTLSLSVDYQMFITARETDGHSGRHCTGAGKGDAQSNAWPCFCEILLIALKLELCTIFRWCGVVSIHSAISKCKD